jgi:hypothetical protein
MVTFESDGPAFIAVCSDIGPLLLAKSGVGVSGILKPPALCLKANTAGVVQLHRLPL